MSKQFSKRRFDSVLSEIRKLQKQCIALLRKRDKEVKRIESRIDRLKAKASKELTLPMDASVLGDVIKRRKPKHRKAKKGKAKKGKAKKAAKKFCAARADGSLK
jgi:hypothetical protein